MAIPSSLPQRSCQEGTSDPCWGLGIAAPILRLGSCDCGDLVLCFFAEWENDPDVAIVIKALSEIYSPERDPVVCPSGRRHIHFH